MFPFGFQEILVVLLICVLVFGAKRLPEIGSGLAKGIKNFKKGLGDGGDELPESNEEPVASASGKPADGDKA
ncbi:MAG: twin-arginine translocase TatA/TatE family subunit [Nitrospinaceae bacterium]|jgi:sec-independent protein translocase protein TatA|nr:twin-arginine translocase TatA/TatE family subunit [Nitrospinaceae bacterium]MBT3435779.1 twin-arginine translocase TatA/TatE family subunit [Nitrospinaceae bacterium]MBT4093533.1 twin-arginine translocase TatA/TatE family subunit [Nitrospinaceae bacterium]MBT5369826.1 twin-arginine translocase TatA/TatE family subunit [Nitrospinaceae bacterium]MBT5947193.1 twin-arginine translocase TatA/TatE family subunit [Nitrospinaceae bacterium]